MVIRGGKSLHVELAMASALPAMYEPPCLQGERRAELLCRGFDRRQELRPVVAPHLVQGPAHGPSAQHIVGSRPQKRRRVTLGLA